MQRIVHTNARESLRQTSVDHTAYIKFMVGKYEVIEVFQVTLKSCPYQ